jgi:polysaccharide biosynthesis protein PslG
MIRPPADADTARMSSHRPRRGRRLLPLLALAAFALALLPAAAAQAKVPKSFFGIDQGGFVTRPDYAQMHDIKVRTFRLAINWKRVEPHRGSFVWAPVDAQIAALAQNGVTPAIFVFGAPEWATGSTNQGVPPLKGSALRDWKKFLKTAVKRYKKNGIFWKQHTNLPMKAVKSWQIWNEPNLDKYFAQSGPFPPQQVAHAPKAYAKLVKASDKAIGRADKHAKVILAGLSGNPNEKSQSPDKFIKKFLKVKKITKHFDAAALHPYAPKIGSYKKLISKFRKALDKKGKAKKKPIWLTEVGWGSANNGQSMNKGRSGQAKLLKKSFKVTLKKRKKWDIDRVYWFDWRDPTPGPRASCSFCPSAGLLEHSGKPKPSYKQFKKFSKKQGGGKKHHHHHHHRAART